jgi:hypothetical protein
MHASLPGRNQVASLLFVDAEKIAERVVQTKQVVRELVTG